MVQKQPKRSEREWIELIRECRASGLSDKAWCKEHGISASTFYHRIKRLKEQEFRWLMEGLSIEQPKAILPSAKRDF